MTIDTTSTADAAGAATRGPYAQPLACFTSTEDVFDAVLFAEQILDGDDEFDVLRRLLANGEGDVRENLQMWLTLTTRPAEWMHEPTVPAHPVWIAMHGAFAQFRSRFDGRSTIVFSRFYELDMPLPNRQKSAIGPDWQAVAEIAEYVSENSAVFRSGSCAFIRCPDRVAVWWEFHASTSTLSALDPVDEHRMRDDRYSDDELNAAAIIWGPIGVTPLEALQAARKVLA